MAKNDNVLGVAKISLGNPGDGVMGGSLTDFTEVELNSVTFSGASSSDETISTEQEDAYLTIGTSADPSTMTFRLYGVHGTEAVLLLGGTYDAPSGEYRAPESIADTYLSMRLTSKTIEGAYMEIDFAYAKISAKHDGSITKSGLLSIDVTATANTPVATGGAKGSPYIIRKVTA